MLRPRLSILSNELSRVSGKCLAAESDLSHSRESVYGLVTKRQERDRPGLAPAADTIGSVLTSYDLTDMIVSFSAESHDFSQLRRNEWS